MPIDSGEFSFQDNNYIRYAALTDKGCVRAHNEDNYGIFVDDNVFCLADGVGGLDAGEIASEELIASVSVSLEGYERKEHSFGEKIISLFRRKRSNNINIGNLIATANLDIYRRAQVLQKRMASTVVLLQVDNGEFAVTHVGDSRAYLLRNKILGQLTNDHTLFMELILAGTPLGSGNQSISPHSITKAMGSQAEVVPEENRLKWIKNDMFLLCSDGLTDMVDDKSIQKIMMTYFPIMQKVGQELVNAAKDAGGRDNITVIVGYIG